MAKRGIGQIFARKSVEQIQTEYGASELKKTLGALNLVLLGIGCIIGAGIFVRTGSAAALHAGPAVILSFVIAGVICALAGLCYAELASALPVSGSAYTYSYTTLGEGAAWLMGALLLLEYGLAASVVAVGWAGYVVSLLADFGVVIPATLTAPFGHEVTLADGTTAAAVMNLPAALVVLALTVLLVVGVSESASFNNAIVAIKVTTIIAVILIGGFYVLTHFAETSQNWVPFIPENEGPGKFGMDGVARAASIVFFAYIGFEAVSTAGQEAKNPKRDLPIGIIGSLVVCTVLYMLVSWVLTMMVNYKELNVPDPVAVAVNALGPEWGIFAKIVKVGAITGLTSVILVLMYGQTRIFYTMARDGLLPKPFSKVHTKFQTPWINTLVVGVIVAGAAAIFDINTLGDLTSVGTLAAFAVVCLTVIFLRQTRPELPRGFKVPLYPVLPVLGIISCIWLITTVEAKVLMFFAWFMAGSVVVYFAYGMWNSKLAKGEVVTGHEPGPQDFETPNPKNPQG